jgi:hypothetical protein
MPVSLSAVYLSTQTDRQADSPEDRGMDGETEKHTEIQTHRHRVCVNKPLVLFCGPDEFCMTSTIQTSGSHWSV